MRFPILILVYAFSLFSTGILFLAISADKNITLLTPLIFGGIIFLMGLVALKKEFSVFGKHAATILSLIAFISNVSSVLDLSLEAVSDYAQFSRFATALISLFFLVLFVKKLGDERRLKEKNNGTE